MKFHYDHDDRMTQYTVSRSKNALSLRKWIYKTLDVPRKRAVIPNNETRYSQSAGIEEICRRRWTTFTLKSQLVMTQIIYGKFVPCSEPHNSIRDNAINTFVENVEKQALEPKIDTERKLFINNVLTWKRKSQ